MFTLFDHAIITLTDWNNLRIEVDASTDVARFYVNGVLKDTQDVTTVDASGLTYMGFGRDTTNPVLFRATAPNVSAQLNSA